MINVQLSNKETLELFNTLGVIPVLASDSLPEKQRMEILKSMRDNQTLKGAIGKLQSCIEQERARQEEAIG